MNDLLYQERIVAFVDVLGFAQLVKASERDDNVRSKISNLIVVNKLFDCVMDDQRFAAATFFSDSFVLSMQPDRIFYMVREIGHLCRCLILHGLPCRGAITAGLLYHQEKFVIGPAFVAAYELEAVAHYPRIILDGNVLEGWKSEFSASSPHAHLEGLLKRDRDGQHFIDIFHRGWAQDFVQWSEIASSGQSIPMNSTDFLREASQRIREGLAAHAHNVRVRTKYEWLASECNSAHELHVPTSSFPAAVPAGTDHHP